MQNLEIKKNDIITLGDLSNVLNIDYSQVNDWDIFNGEQTSLDNFDGNNGINVIFEIIEKEESEDYYKSHEWKIKIISIDEL